MSDHELRRDLNDEIHGRTSGPVKAPTQIRHLAYVLSTGASDPFQAVVELSRALEQPEPIAGSLHHRLALEDASMRFERHGEFYRISIVAPSTTWRAPPSLEQWIGQLPGKRMVAINTKVFRKSSRPAKKLIASRFEHEDVAASSVSQGKAIIWTDFKIKDDGYTHVIVEDNGMSPMRMGRMLRRMHEIETYRMMALMALPLARSLQTPIALMETNLGETVDRIHDAPGSESDKELLREIMTVARDVERLKNQSTYRFSASRAYATIVRKRIEELEEARVENYQRIGILLDRRFEPAMATCVAVAQRISELGERSERAGNLLRTRVDIALETQNQKLLESMNARAKQQLHLQQTVEGLSIVAVTYYGVSLVAKAAGALRGYVPLLDENLIILVSIPIVAALAWAFLKNAKGSLGQKT